LGKAASRKVETEQENWSWENAKELLGTEESRRSC